MRRFFAVSLSCASLLAALPGVAAAQPVHHARHSARVHVARTTHVASATRHSAPPLIVHGRSFLDPGNVVPVGSLTNYVNESTIYNRTPDQMNQRSKFGNEALPGPFDLVGAGRPQPLFEFSTGGY